MLIYRRVKRLADSNDVILDLGTKNGRHLCGIPGNVIGVDIDLRLPLEVEEVNYICADGCQLPFADDVFDYVILNQVLEHIEARRSIVSEVARILKPTGEALFSFPNRFALSKPHGLPRFLSAMPRSLGKRIASRILDPGEFEYYKKHIFPLSPIGARRLFSENFSEIKYVTIDESVENTDIYGDSFGARTFVTLISSLQLFTQIPGFPSIFEYLWPYCGYKCSI